MAGTSKHPVWETPGSSIHDPLAFRQDGSTHDPQLCLLHTHCHRRTTGKRQASTLHTREP